MIDRIRDTIKLLTPVRFHRLVLQCRFALRGPGSSSRVLPDFMVIGTVRGGTSSLFRYLASHPCIFPSLRKETLYFSHLKYYKKGELWYRRHFPTAFQIRLSERLLRKKILTFEATPNYFSDAAAAQRAQQLIPNAKLILLLRNPVERAFSHYQHGVRRGVEKRSFEAVMDIALQISDPQKVLNNPYEDRDLYRALDYFHTGLYADHWENWTKCFPRENFFVVKSEDFFERTAETFNQILAFLQLSSIKKQNFRNYSYWAATRPKAIPEARMSNGIRQKLKAFYASSNARLNQMLERDFGWD